jgi:hypothetical protein
MINFFLAINLLEYLAKYGYVLTRNRVQIFNHASIFGYKQTLGYKQKFLEKHCLAAECGGEVRYHVAAVYEVPFLLPTHVTNGSAGGSLFGFVFAAVHGFPGKATAEIMVAGWTVAFLRILCSLPTLRSYF